MTHPVDFYIRLDRHGHVHIIGTLRHRIGATLIDPEDPSELEIESCTLEDGTEVELNSRELDFATEMAEGW